MWRIEPCELKTLTASSQTASPPRNRRIVLLCLALCAAMVGLAYAAVPLYRLFCEATGYGGVTQRAAAAPSTPIGRMMTVEFDANIGAGLPWSFRPVQRRLTVKVGEEAMAHYRAVNHSAEPVTGSAVFNVTPGHAGRYFSKIDCFCFVEQTLAPGQSVDMPVVFFIDPSIADDEDLAQLKTITLSYTFYPLATDKISGRRSKASAGSVN
jgi:cytochrome c oxidase assembly protein subunit 11